MKNFMKMDILQKRGMIIEFIKKNYLKIGVYLLVCGVVLGAIIVATEGAAMQYIGKTIGMLLVIILMMLILADNTKKLASNKKGVQLFALISIITNFMWVILWTLAIWGVFEILTYEPCDYYPHYYSAYETTRYCANGITVMGKATLIITLISVLGLFGSNILNIKEYNQKGVFLPLKITTIICLIYSIGYVISIILFDTTCNPTKDRMASLAGFAGFIWIVIWTIMVILSNNAKNKAKTAAKTTKNKTKKS